MNKEWIQETNSLLEKYESRKEALLARHERIEADLRDIDEQLTSLEQRIQVGHDLISDYIKEHPTITTTPNNIRMGNLAKKDYPDMLIEIAKQSDGILNLSDVTDILFDAKVDSVKNRIRHNVSNTLARLDAHFARIGRGQYRFTNHAEARTERKKVKPSTKTKYQRTKSGLRDKVKEIKDAHPQWTRQEVMNYLHQINFDFKTKFEGQALALCWARLGYSKENKQQPLPIGASVTIPVERITAVP